MAHGRISLSVGFLTAMYAGLSCAADARASGVTFNKDVAPVVFKHCAACHRPGEVAPFSLLTYADVRKRARQIVEVTSTRQMPPWKPVAQAGTFVGERLLAADELALLKRWLDAGAPEGDAKDLPPAPKFAAGWLLGEPDLVIPMPQAYTLPAEGRDVYRNFVIPVEIPAGKYIRAVEYRPGNRRVVHHAILSSDNSGKFRPLDGKDGAPGFSSGGIGGSILPGSAGFWVPGKLPQPLPDGVSFAWPRGADLVLQLHLHPSGKPEVEQSTIGVFFTADPPRRSLGGMTMMAHGINIPAGERAYRTREEKRLDADAEVVGIFPHMHWIGKEARITAVLPDGTRKPLLQIDQWDFNWQGYYEYVTPIQLPRGTLVVMEYTHDNSADNPANPNNPPRAVTGGEQTSNEMSAVLINLITTRAPARTTAAGIATATTRPAVAADLAQAAEALKRYDTDGDQKLSLAELSQIASANPADLPALIKRFDRDGDQKLTAAELAQAIATLKQH